MDNISKYTITYGGWYQRTTLHLSEIYYFFSQGKSALSLKSSKLEILYQKLNLAKVKRKAGYLEYIWALTNDDIEIRYYEDGLYVLELHGEDIQKAKSKLKNYFENAFEPAVNYIFSLGAPTPKILADIKTEHPFVIGVISDDPNNFKVDKAEFGEVYATIQSEGICVFKTQNDIFVAANRGSYKMVEDINEMQIFFREFKDQLQKYLEIHRILWEKITKVKELKEIKGDEVQKIRMRLDSYSKTVTLITRRINQMGSYVDTRASVAKFLKVESHLMNLFQYKFEVLTNTLDYIKEIWAMTKEYLDSGIKIIVELQNKSTDVGLRSLRLVTTFGALAGTISYISANRIPQITSQAVIFFVILLILTIVLDKIVVFVYKRVKYKIEFGKDVVRIK